MSRKRRRPRKKETGTSGLGEWRLFLVALVLGVIAYFLQDFVGFRYRLVGSYVWVAVFLLAFTLGLFYFAQFLLPVAWQESWFEGLRQIISYNLANFAALIGAVAYKAPKSVKPSEIEPGLSLGFMRHGAGMIQSHHALALKKGMAFSRAAGPGFVTLQKGERVDQVLDLRRHFRSYDVEARTRDGIPLETTLSLEFQVRMQDEPAEENLAYPYESSAVFHVNYLGTLNTESGSLDWCEQIGRQAVTLLAEAFRRYSFDELYELEPSTARPLEGIERRLTRQLELDYAGRGVAILNTNVGQFKLRQDLIEQRVSNWQAGWRNRLIGEQAAGDAQALKRLKLARARAQIEIIETITRSIDAVRKRPDADLGEIVALRMIEALQEGAADEAVRGLIPDQAMRLVRGLLGQGGGGP